MRVQQKQLLASPLLVFRYNFLVCDNEILNMDSTEETQ